MDPENQSLKVLDGRFDIIHAASFFHLFGWDEQVKVGERIVKFLKPDVKNSFVLGRQVGTREPLTLEAYREKGERRYLHDVKTFQALWDEIGAKTGTKWKAGGELVETWFEATGERIPRMVFTFVVNRVD